METLIIIILFLGVAALGYTAGSILHDKLTEKDIAWALKQMLLGSEVRRKGWDAKKEYVYYSLLDNTYLLVSGEEKTVWFPDTKDFIRVDWIEVEL